MHITSHATSRFAFPRKYHETLEKALLAWQSNIDGITTSPAFAYGECDGYNSILLASDGRLLTWRDGKVGGSMIEHLPEGLTPGEIVESLLDENGQ